jgi:hypothetical protein
MNALAHSYVFWIGVILVLLALYVLPSVIAIIRQVEGLGWIIVINLLPTGIGWLAALVGALVLPRRDPRAWSKPADGAEGVWPVVYASPHAQATRDRIC